MLKLSLNGESTELPPGSNLQDAINAAGFGEQKIAAAINGEFVPRASYNDTPLNTGDCIDIVKPVGGG